MTHPLDVAMGLVGVAACAMTEPLRDIDYLEISPSARNISDEMCRSGCTVGNFPDFGTNIADLLSLANPHTATSPMFALNDFSSIGVALKEVLRVRRGGVVHFVPEPVGRPRSFGRTGQYPHGTTAGSLYVNSYLWVAIGLLEIARRRCCNILVECDTASFITNMTPLFEFIMNHVGLAKHTIYKGSYGSNRIGMMTLYSTVNLEQLTTSRQHAKDHMTSTFKPHPTSFSDYPNEFVHD